MTDLEKNLMAELTEIRVDLETIIDTDVLFTKKSLNVMERICKRISIKETREKIKERYREDYKNKKLDTK